MKPFWTTERRIVASFGLALVVLCIVTGVSVWQTLALEGDLAEVSARNNVLQAISEFRNAMAQMAGAARLLAINHSDSAFQQWQTDRDDMEDKLRVVNQLTTGSILQQVHLRELEQVLQEKIGQTKRDTTSETIQALWATESLVPVRKLLLSMDKEEQDYLEIRNAQATQGARAALLTVGLASTLALLMVGMAMVRILQDLKERRRVAEELVRARWAAESASLAKSAFLANMSHELRTPLTAIMGYADVLLFPEMVPEGQGRNRREEYLQTMRRSGEHLLTLINDILDVSKIEADRTTIEALECRLVDVLADLDSMMRARATEKKITFAVEYATPIPERVVTDPTRLRQILMNLTGNAVKFTDAGDVRMVVTFKASASKNDSPQPQAEAAAGELVVEVIDTGIGIAVKEQEILFQPFAQADVSTTRRFGGTGLGLSISRHLARKMKGDITLQSELGRGSTFRLSLPMAAAGTVMLEPGDARHAVSGAGRSLENRQRQLGVRVLLAEDGEESREVVTLHLRHAGCDVTCAHNGEEAYRAAIEASRAGTPFQIVLMDMQMPVMDGYTATSKLRADGYQGVIVALTAHALKEDRDRCMRAGCDEYAAKPIDMPALLALIERLSGQAGIATVTDRMMENPVLRGLTRKFCEGTVQTMAQLRETVRRGAMGEVAAAAHKLAGTGGAYGFDEITREAKMLENLARGSEKNGAIAKQLAKLETTCMDAREQFADEAKEPV